MPDYSLDVAPHGCDVRQPSLELGLAQVYCHCVRQGAGLLAKEPYELSELRLTPADRTG